ncbi:type II secretion system GspH family protein [Flavobacterium sp. MXW15]|uniref:Type II secretion system GspH family protein n=1 Tax=Xanthomonas chitinilytica TaxID=2989819 RepID=A0ABT3JVR9_9XANT|nr:type II secretion system protein [Xanthomonas sp. H13-6]MCW4454805.1 type II secretion system GspH family protein [Flavobacterium sp. MXW15]MCW4472567.1 type II secretion system GspH family protein [Xanthomonas sp. H13-6]
MLITSTRDQRGITLIEIILVCAIVAAATAGLFVFAKKTSVTAAVEKEQRQVEDIVKTVDSMFALQPNFAALGTNGAEYLSTRGAARAGLNLGKDAGGTATLTTALGSGELNLAAWSVDTGTGPAVPNSGYRLAYQGLTANECSRLVTATYSIAHQVSVARNGLDDSGATALASRGKLTASPEQIAETCSGSRAPSVFLYFAPARAIAATTAATPVPAPRCKPVHETQQVACPAGQIGSITQERDGTCTGPGNALVYTAWTTTDNTCAAAVSPPPTVTPPVVADSCSTETFTRVEACPAGQTGHIIQQRTLDSCAGTYTPWTTTSTTCQSPVPGATCTPTTEERQLSCPPGQTSPSLPPIIQVRSSSCSSPTATPDWTPWETIRNTCRGTATCVAPAPEWRPAPYKGACPAGMTGTGSNWTTGERRTWTCPSPTGSPTNTGWVWDGTSGVFVDNGDCVANCVVPSPSTQTNTETRTATQTLSCPAGQSGAITQSRSEVRTQTRTASCPTATGPVSWTPWSAWSAWAGVSEWATVSNTCNVLPPLPGCYCSGSYFDGVGFVNSFGSFPNLAACETARAGNTSRQCRAEITPFPTGSSCYHMVRNSWHSEPRRMFCEAI